MGVIRSRDYHDYVIVGEQFIGEFEQMYQQCEDPWQQDADGLSEREPLRRLALEEIRRLAPRCIVDVGCGLGYFTDQMRQCLPGAEVVGVDVSPTAVRKASARYPACRFEVVQAVELERLRQRFDLIVCNELFWYVLSDLETVFRQIASIAHERSVLLIMQYFPPPEEQRFGREAFVGPEGLLSRLPFRVIKTVEVNRLLGATDRARQGKAGSHRVLMLCDRLTASERSA